MEKQIGERPSGATNGLAADMIGKDTNFRGLTISDNVVYTTKGSGSNRVHTVQPASTALAGLICDRLRDLPQPVCSSVSRMPS
jgi:hypothetical protein